MAGTKAGGAKARDTNLKKHGANFYKRIGAKGGRNGCGPNYRGGFASSTELARRAGAKGGRISRRRPAKKPKDKFGGMSIEQAQKRYEEAKNIYEEGVLA